MKFNYPFFFFLLSWASLSLAYEVHRSCPDELSLSASSVGVASRRRPALDRAPVNLRQVQDLIRDKGLFTVYPGRRPSPHRVAVLEAMHGTRVVFAGDFERGAPADVPPTQTHRLSGVALHVGDYVELGMDHIVGELNLHNILKDPSDLMSGKVSEVKVLRRYAPGVMPSTKLYNELLADYPRLAKARGQIRKMIQDLVLSMELRPALETYVFDFFEMANREFPMGSLFKLEGEFKTGDSDTLLTSYATQPQDVVDAFLRAYAQLRGRVLSKKISPDDLVVGLAQNSARKIDLLGRMIFNPEEVLIQQRLDLAHTPLGYPYEIRIDVLGGIPLRPMMRHSYEYLPSEIGEGARKFLSQQVIAKLPDSLQRSAAGYDVMRLNDGSFSVVESNAGPQSGTIAGDLNAIPTNVAISELVGSPTDLIQFLESVFLGSLDTQRAVLLDPVSTHLALSDPALLEKNRANLFAWLRDRHVDEWKKDPTSKKRTVVLARLKALSVVVSVTQNDNLLEIYRSAELAMATP